MMSDEPMILYGCFSRCGKTYCMEEFRKNNEQKSQKSNEDNSIGQFKLMEMNDESKSGENSKKSEGFSRYE